MSHLRLYEHPANRRLFGVGVPQLYISGTLPNGAPLVAYEGRLQIENAGGPCTVEMLSGTLPLGATVDVDNDTKEIVVRWPAYQADNVLIPNAGFESAGGWNMGAGWSQTEDNPVTGLYAAQYVDNSGDSLITNKMKAPVGEATSIAASCSVRQGASSSGNAGGCVLVEFFDSSDDSLLIVEGNLISQGSNNEVQLSSVASPIPSTAASVRIGARGFRKRQNKKVWVDDFSWNLTQPSVGTDSTGLWCISLRVRDSLGREADWSGCIAVVDRDGSYWNIADSTQGVDYGSIVANGSRDASAYNNVLTTALSIGIRGVVTHHTDDGGLYYFEVEVLSKGYAPNDTDSILAGFERTEDSLTAFMNTQGQLLGSLRGVASLDSLFTYNSVNNMPIVATNVRVGVLFNLATRKVWMNRNGDWTGGGGSFVHYTNPAGIANKTAPVGEYAPHFRLKQRDNLPSLATLRLYQYADELLYMPPGAQAWASDF